ncbi:hypothetical protein [Nitratifractor sp.]
MKIDHKAFETLLKAKGISKKAFSAYSGIPYYTVAGWKKSGEVPNYAMILLRNMPTAKAYITAGELIEAGLPKAILWNNDPDKKVPVDIFIVATLQRAYNDFVVQRLAEFFGGERILAALLKHKERVSDKLIEQVTAHLQDYQRTDGLGEHKSKRERERNHLDKGYQI